MRIAVAQFNATVGDLTGNVERILKCAAQAKARGAQVLLTPELSLCGYPPEDLLLRPDFYRACRQALDDLASRVEGIVLIVGYPEESEGRCYNAAMVIENGQKKAVYRKIRLPNYEVFDEQRYFEAGSEACVVTIAGVRCGINICADIWGAGSFRTGLHGWRRVDAGAQCLALPSGKTPAAGAGARRTDRGDRGAGRLRQSGRRPG